MRAIILAAGRGSRLRELTAQKPKCLVPFLGQPLLGRTLTSLIQGGCSAVTLVAGYKHEEITDFVHDIDLPTHIVLNPRWDSTNMVQSLRAAESWLLSEPCIISYGDIFFDPAIVQNLIASDHDIALAYDKYGRSLWEERFDDPLSDIEHFQFDQHSKLTQIGGKVSDITSVHGQYMGLLKVQPNGYSKFLKILQGLHETEQDNIDMTTMISNLLSIGQPVHVVENHAPWGELDSPEDVNFFEARSQSTELEGAR